MPNIYKPTKEEREARTDVYGTLQDMVKLRGTHFPQFSGDDGDRTLEEYIDDSDRRLNGYTLSRSEQGKEDWQANIFNPVTRRKMKAIIAGVALNVPELEYTAVNKTGLFSSKRAEVIKQLVRHSRLQGNSNLNVFFELWEILGKGTVVKFDGYLKTKFPRKFIKSYDLVTGKVEFEEREEIVEDRPIDLHVPLSEFYIADYHMLDVQDQPQVCWVQHYNAAQLEQEFKQYPNYDLVKEKKRVQQYTATQNTYFYDKWNNRVEEEDDFEVVRYFDKEEDRYEIWVNGVPLLRAPLLWGKAQKLYPFSKSIAEPFEGKTFFYGKSFPSLLEGLQDVDNTAFNSMLDKMYRSLVPPILVGLANKDLLDLEDELVDQDNKIYVPDVSQVKPMPFDGVSNGDMAMLQAIARLEELTSVDQTQQGIQGEGVTAREVLIADERAREMKGIIFMFLEDLWLQKTRVRIQNILMNYMQPKIERVAGKGSKKVIREALNLFNVSDVELSDGSRGMLGIQIQKSPKKLFDVTEIEAREDAAQNEGINYKLVAITSDYLDDWELDFSLTSQSIFNQSQVRKDAEVMEKLQRMAAFFPERLVANKDKLFGEFVDIYDESPEEYEEAPPQQTTPEGSPLSEGEELLNPTDQNARQQNT